MKCLTKSIMPRTGDSFFLSSINWSNITSGIQYDGTTKSLVINPVSGNWSYRLVIP
jgi:hypothetical protein